MKIKQVKLSEITPYPNNSFTHSEKDLERVKKSILRNEYINPLILWQNNVIIAGHLRYQALSQLNPEQEIQVIDASHLSAEEANKFRLLDNKKPEIDFSAMKIELNSLYETKDLDLILEETGIKADFLMDNIDKQDDGFLEGIPEKERNTKNETEIVRRKEEAEIRFTLSIEQYELYKSLKADVLKACSVSSPGEFFMLHFLQQAKKFGVEI